MQNRKLREFLVVSDVSAVRGRAAVILGRVRLPEGTHFEMLDVVPVSEATARLVREKMEEVGDGA